MSAADKRVRLAAGYVLPDAEQTLDNDGRCLRSDLLPEHCGLPCHLDSSWTGVADDLVDHLDAA